MMAWARGRGKCAGNGLLQRSEGVLARVGSESMTGRDPRYGGPQSAQSKATLY
jgi:hypothetical protein